MKSSQDALAGVYRDLRRWLSNPHCPVLPSLVISTADSAPSRQEGPAGFPLGGKGDFPHNLLTLDRWLSISWSLCSGGSMTSTLPLNSPPDHLSSFNRLLRVPRPKRSLGFWGLGGEQLLSPHLFLELHHNFIN